MSNSVSALLAASEDPLADARRHRAYSVNNGGTQLFQLGDADMCVSLAERAFTRRPFENTNNENMDDSTNLMVQREHLRSGAYTSWLVLGVPAALLDRSGGMLSFRRGDSDEGRAAAYLHMVVEFMLSTYAFVIDELLDSPGADVKACDVLHVYLEAVLHDTPADLPLQDPPAVGVARLTSENLRTMFTQQKFADLFTEGNYAGYRLHFVVFDTRLAVARMMRHRVIRNQHISKLVEDNELLLTRIILATVPYTISEDECVRRVMAALYEHRQEKYMRDHPQERGSDSNPVRQPDTADVKNYILRAKSMPSDNALQRVRHEIQRGAGELYTAILTSKDVVELLYNYTRLCEATTTDDEQPPTINGEEPVPWREGGSAPALAPHKVFTLENSTRLLQRFSPYNSISPHQAESNFYGLGSIPIRSAPFPHLVFSLPVGVLAPRTMMLYRAPWDNITPFELVCRDYEEKIRQSNAIESAQRSSGTDMDHSAGGSVTLASEADQVYGSGMKSRGHLMTRAGFGDRARTDADTQRHMQQQQSVLSERRHARANAGKSSASSSSSGGAAAVESTANSFVASVMAGKDPLRDSSAMRAMGIDPSRFGRADDAGGPQVKRFISGITLMQRETTKNRGRISCIVEQVPTKHGPLSCASSSSERERLDVRRDCERRLMAALNTTVERQYEALLMRGDSTLSTMYLAASNKLRDGALSSIVVPSFIRKKGYSMESYFYYAFFQDMTMCYGFRTEMTMPRQLFINAQIDTMRPTQFESTSHVTIGPSQSGKSHSMVAAGRQHPTETQGTATYSSSKATLAGGEVRTNQLTLNEELDHFLANGTPREQAKNRAEVDMFKKRSTAQFQHIARLGKSDEYSDWRTTTVEVECGGSNFSMGNYLYMTPGSDPAPYSRLNINFLMPTRDNGTTSASRMLNFGQRQQSELVAAFEARRVTLNTVAAIILGASEVGALPGLDMTIPSYVLFEAVRAIARFAPDIQTDLRKERRYFTYVLSAHMQGALYQETASMISKYLVWDNPGQPGARVVGVEPFRMDTLRQVWANHMFVKASPSVIGLYDMFIEHRKMRPWQALYVAATRLCGFDRYIYEPIYRQHGLLPDVQQRADEFVPGDDHRGRGTLPSFITEYDSWIDTMTMHAREHNARTGGMSVANSIAHRFPSFLRFPGSYKAFVFALTQVLTQNFNIEAIQVNSMMDQLCKMSIKIPVLASLEDGVPVTSERLSFMTTRVAGVENQYGNPNLLLHAGEEDYGREEAVAQAAPTFIHWVEKPVITVIRTYDNTQRRRHASGGSDAETASGAVDENGNEVQIAIHYLMIKLHELFYIGATEWCDPRTAPARIMVPFPSIYHEEVMHTLEVGPRYHVPEKTTYNPNYKGTNFHLMSMDADTSSLSDVLGGIDIRSTLDRSLAQVDPSRNAPVTTYRISPEFDAWISFLRTNHMDMPPEDLERIEALNDRVEVSELRAVEQLATKHALCAALHATDQAALEWMQGDTARREALAIEFGGGGGGGELMETDTDNPGQLTRVQIEKLVARQVERARGDALERSPILVRTWGLPPKVARRWPTMTAYDRWAVLHPDAPMRTERRLETLQERNTTVSKSFRRPLAEIDENRHPEVDINHVECSSVLRLIVENLLPMRDLTRGLGPMPVGLPSATAGRVRKMCLGRQWPGAMTFVEAAEFLDYADIDGAWGALFASTSGQLASESRRAKQIRAMIVDMVVSQMLAAMPGSTDTEDMRTLASDARKLITTGLMSFTPVDETREYRSAWDNAAVLMLIYYRGRLQQIRSAARMHAVMLYNNAVAYGAMALYGILGHTDDTPVAQMKIDYVKRNLTPVELYLYDKQKLPITESLALTTRTPTLRSHPKPASKRTTDAALPPNKRTPTGVATPSESDDDSLLGSAMPSSSQIDAAAAELVLRIQKKTSASLDSEVSSDAFEAQELARNSSNSRQAWRNSGVGFASLFPRATMRK